MIGVTHFTDPGCPWAYSAWPAHTTLKWRYGEQLSWTLVMIGLTEDADQYAARGFTTTLSAIGYGRFRRFGMPFQITPKARLSATSPGCRAIVATRLAAPPLEEAALRALQVAQFTTTGTLDDPETLRSALSAVEGLDADAAWEASTSRRSWPPTRPTVLVRERRPDPPPSSRAGPPPPTGRCVTRRRRYSSMGLTGSGWRLVASSRLRRATSSSRTWIPRSRAGRPSRIRWKC
jgi:protein-disulfide isomerase-like protein with CxxC motif